jgi:hypothetical protein
MIIEEICIKNKSQDLIKFSIDQFDLIMSSINDLIKF